MKRIYSICLVVFLCLFQVTPAFASVATSSDWILDEDTATSSDWNYFTPFDWDSYEADFGISPLTVSLPSVTNTVSNRRLIKANLVYYDKSNVQKVYAVNLGDDGYFNMTVPSDCKTPRFLYFSFSTSANVNLPPPGTYKMTYRFSLNAGGSTAGGIQYTTSDVYSSKVYSNTQLYQTSKVFSDFQQDYGDASGSAVIDIGTMSFFQIRIFYVAQPLYSTIQGWLNVNFTKSFDTPDYTTAGGAQSSEDVQKDIAGSAGQIADNTAAIDGTLKQLIQHISDQLHALWDQMYNYMHVPLVNNDNARTQRIIDRMDEGFDINVEVLDRNFHDLMENDDKNTDRVTNGYDNSTFNSANSQLDSSVNQYGQAETGIFDSVKENVTGFTIPDFTSNVQVLTAVGFCSNYLQRLFNAIGLYNLPVTVSLVMIFVLMVLGYYRVRS